MHPQNVHLIFTPSNFSALVEGGFGGPQSKTTAIVAVDAKS